MVINKIIRRVVGKKSWRSFRLPKLRRSVANWVISDRNRNPYSHAHIRRITYTQAWSNITSTNQQDNISQTIDAGDEIYQRSTNLIHLKRLRLQGTIYWDTGATPASMIRIVACSVDNGATPSISVNTNVYGRDAIPTIRHVYYDKLFVRGQTTTINTKVRFNINLRSLKLRYNGPTGSTDSVDKNIVILYVSDVVGATTDINDLQRTLSWYEN